ncbi:MAG: PA14 domain-containing protein [Chloroflexota bacterium]
MKFSTRLLTLGALALIIGVLAFIPTAVTQAQTDVTWTAIYYPDTDFGATSGTSRSGFVYTGGLSENFGTGAPTDPTTGQPITGIPADGWSARYSANATIAAGTYEFIVLGDGGVRLQINNEVVINDLTTQGSSTRTAIRTLTGGQFALTLDYIDFTGNAVIQINWVTSDGTPSQQQPTAVPANLVNVVQVRGLSVRTGPFLGGSLVAVARPGVSYPVLARNTQEGLFSWYLIQFDEDTIGWSSGRYLAFETGAPENVPLQNTTAFDTIYDPPGRVVGVTRSVMNFRTLPTRRVARIPEIPQLEWGAEVEILARTVQGGEDFWYQVRYNTENGNSYVGWIFAPYVGIQFGSDPIDTVPIL